MRILLPFAAFGILLAAYSGYWLYLSHTLGETISELRVRWHEAGVEVKHGELSVGGYPYRIEVTARDVEAAGQDGSVNWRWRTPILQATRGLWTSSKRRGRRSPSLHLDWRPVLYQVIVI